MEFSSNLDAVSAILQICLIDLLLSGDNAIVIAMACASLPDAVRPRAVLLGTGAAVLFRVILTFVATLMLRAPYLKLAGAGLLLLIAIELLAGDGGAGRTGTRRAADGGVWRAVAIIVVADAVMSLDNVVAVAAAAQDNLLYLLAGLVISVPILVFSSLFLSRLLERYPLLVDGGAALLGWIAGKIAVSDPAFADALQMQSFGLVTAAPLLGALYVVIQGRRLRRERAASSAAKSTAAPATSHPSAALQADSPRVAGSAAVMALGVPAVAAIITVPMSAKVVEPVSETVSETVSEKVAAPVAAPVAEPVAAAPALETAVIETPVNPASPPGGEDAFAIPELDLPRRFSRMDLTIMAGVAVPLLGLLAMIVYFIVHAAISH